MSALPKIDRHFHLPREGEPFLPYARDEQLSRPWAVPGTPGLEHRLGGPEKQHETGNVSYDPENHEFMVKLRAEKVKRVARALPPTEVVGAQEGEAVFVSWGGTYGSVRAATRSLNRQGHAVGHVHLTHINPMPSDLSERLSGFKELIVPELNLGQLAFLLRSALPAELVGRLRSAPKVQGKPFKERELVALVIGDEAADALYQRPDPLSEAADDEAQPALVQIDDARR